MANPVVFTVKKDRFDYWMKVGAQVSEGLRKLLKGKKLNQLNQFNQLNQLPIQQTLTDLTDSTD